MKALVPGACCSLPKSHQCGRFWDSCQVHTSQTWYFLSDSKPRHNQFSWPGQINIQLQDIAISKRGLSAKFAKQVSERQLSFYLVQVY